MSETSFVKTEELSQEGSGLLALNYRLFRSLPLFLSLLPLSVLTIILSSVAPSFFRWYAGSLSSEGSGSGANFHPIPHTHLRLVFSLEGLLLITLLAVVFRVLAWAFFEISGMWSAKNIHAQMVESLSRTRTTFFDENPSGRLINRLVKDFDEVRSTAIIFVGDFFNAGIEILSIALIACLASPYALAATVILLLGFSYVQSQRSAMIEHSRAMAAVATSHVIGRKTDLIEGREVYLIYDRAELLIRRMSRSFRQYVKASAIHVQIDTWASFWIRIFAEGFSLVILLFVAFALQAHRLDVATAGVIISSLFGITGSIGWLDIATSYVSRSAPHVRRVFEFVDLPAEDQEEGKPSLEKHALQTSEARVGDISFENYSMSYRKDTPLILRGINLSIPLGSKVALVGRTGSGKTSVAQALLRMVFVQGGEIKIAGRSIYTMDMLSLRRLFGVVPQFPYLFAGTIRSNIDRLGVLAEERIRSAIETVGLSYPADQAVAEGGQNLSVGERQLVCLARVIAARREIIVMDEPTSGLDPQTDARINHILKTTFSSKTVLTIAHRRESLGHYDKIVELSCGQMIKVGTASEFLREANPLGVY